MLLFKEKEIRESVLLDKHFLHSIAEGFTQLDQGRVVQPPIMIVDVPENNGEIDVKSAYIKGFDTLAVKISSGFLDNRLHGLPTSGGMILLLNSVIGFPEAIFLDNGYLTDIRTAAAGAVAADNLAKKKVSTVGVIGSGVQAKLQIEALVQVRSFKKLLIYSRTRKSAEAYVQYMKKKLPNIEIIIEDNPEILVRKSEIVVTTTPSKEPIVQADWLHAGLHITAMGSDTAEKQEIDSRVFQRVDTIVCDVIQQCLHFGELHHAVDQGMIALEDGRIVELGTLTSGRRPGRQNDEQITICDLTGTGVQDTVAARFAYERLIHQKNR